VDRSARISSLRRYISLLRSEENRLNGVISSKIASLVQRSDAEIGLREIAEKLLNADKELVRLEGHKRT
jgi:hypothetical protein